MTARLEIVALIGSDILRARRTVSDASPLLPLRTKFLPSGTCVSSAQGTVVYDDETQSYSVPMERSKMSEARVATAVTIPATYDQPRT